MSKIEHDRQLALDAAEHIIKLLRSGATDDNCLSEGADVILENFGDMDAAIEAVAAERERCAKLVPTNWLDPLLTGDGVTRPPLGERAIEALLRGIQDRIRNA